MIFLKLNFSSKIEILKRKVCKKSCNLIEFFPLSEFKLSIESGYNCSTPNPAQSTQLHPFPFKLIPSTSFWGVLGWGEHYYQPEVLYYYLTLLLDYSGFHLLLSQHKKCSYSAPIRDIDPNFFGLCRYEPNLRLEVITINPMGSSK